MNSNSVQNIPPPTLSPPSSAPSSSTMFSGSNGVIIVLLVLLLLSFLGINLLILSGNALKTLAEIFGPVVYQVAGMIGYSTGNLVNTTAELTSDVAKLGVDIAEGTAHSVGDLLKNGSKGGMDEDERKRLDQALAPSRCPPPSAPAPDSATHSIQTAISSKKSGWCLVGEENGKRGCVRVDEHDKCMSGQIFPSQEKCMNPN